MKKTIQTYRCTVRIKKLKYVILRKKSKHTKISKLCTSDFVSPFFFLDILLYKLTFLTAQMTDRWTDRPTDTNSACVSFRRSWLQDHRSAPENRARISVQCHHCYYSRVYYDALVIALFRLHSSRIQGVH